MTASLTTFKVVVLERVLPAPSLLLCLNYSSFTLFPQGKFKAPVKIQITALLFTPPPKNEIEDMS